jgi:hypothetical protein
VPAARLHGRLGPREQPGVVGGACRREGDVIPAGDELDGRREVGEGGAGGVRVEGAGRIVGGRRLRVPLGRLPGVVGLGGSVPAAVGDGGDRLPVGVGGLAGPDPLEGGGRVREPGLAAAQLGDLLAVEVGDLQADRPRAGADQGEAADAVGMAGGVQEGEGRARRMGQAVWW